MSQQHEELPARYRYWTVDMARRWFWTTAGCRSTGKLCPCT